jgi:hypothetical protein
MRTTVVVVAIPAALLAGALLCLLALPVPAVAAARSTTLSVLSFGAAADGVTDDAKVPEFYQVRQLAFDVDDVHI